MQTEKKKYEQHSNFRKALKLLRQGKLTVAEIKQATGVSAYYQNQIRRDYNLSDSAKISFSKRKEDITYKVITLLKQGKKSSEIETELGVSKQRISQIKQKVDQYKLI
jgi:uncharacterized protein YerC